MHKQLTEARDLLERERRRPLVRPVDVRHHLVVPGREIAHVSVQLSHRHESVLRKGLRGCGGPGARDKEKGRANKGGGGEYVEEASVEGVIAVAQHHKRPCCIFQACQDDRT